MAHKSSIVMPTISVNYFLTSGMVPWCQSEEPSQFIIVALCFLPIFGLDDQSETMAELT